MEKIEFENYLKDKGIAYAFDMFTGAIYIGLASIKDSETLREVSENIGNKKIDIAELDDDLCDEEWCGAIVMEVTF